VFGIMATLFEIYNTRADVRTAGNARQQAKDLRQV